MTLILALIVWLTVGCVLAWLIGGASSLGCVTTCRRPKAHEARETLISKPLLTLTVAEYRR